MKYLGGQEEVVWSGFTRHSHPTLLRIFNQFDVLSERNVAHMDMFVVEHCLSKDK